MNRYIKIYRHPRYIELLQRLEVLEKDRKFCRHNMQHFLDVARIMLILSFEQNLSVSKDIIYAAALLHDIGRVSQYEQNIPHNKASADIAETILKDCGYESRERLEICNAILNHRNGGDKSCDLLESLLYRADKLSRLCFSCKANDECYWSAELKNSDIVI